MMSLATEDAALWAELAKAISPPATGTVGGETTGGAAGGKKRARMGH